MTNQRILIFSLSYYPMVGGAEMAIRELTDRLTDIDFDLVTLRFSPDHPRVEDMGRVAVYRVGSTGNYLNKILFIPRATWFAWRNRSRYSGFWCMMTNMLFPVALLRLAGNRKPYILTLQDGDPFEHVFDRKRIKLFKPLLVYGFRHATVIQPISNFLATWAKMFAPEANIEVVPNGVDIPLFTQDISTKAIELTKQELRRNPNDIFLASSSRLVPKNGIVDVVHALPHIPENIHFINFGAGPGRDELVRLARDLGIENRVQLVPFPGKELPRFLRACDIFIRPSLSEGQGIAFLQGMAVGIPVIGTPVGGIVDFLKDGETGVFCQPHNPKSIAEAVVRLVNDKELCKKVIENGLKLVREKYDWDLIAREMRDKVFSKVL